MRDALIRGPELSVAQVAPGVVNYLSIIMGIVKGAPRECAEGVKKKGSRTAGADVQLIPANRGLTGAAPECPGGLCACSPRRGKTNKGPQTAAARSRRS